MKHSNRLTPIGRLAVCGLHPICGGPLHDTPGSGAIIFSLRMVLLRCTLVTTRRFNPLRGEIYVQHGEGGKVTKGVAAAVQTDGASP